MNEKIRNVRKEIDVGKQQINSKLKTSKFLNYSCSEAEENMHCS